jgi:hypothetical protein
VTDDDRGVEIAQLQSIMECLQERLRSIPAVQREYIAKALLSMAVEKLLRDGGRGRKK